MTEILGEICVACGTKNKIDDQHCGICGAEIQAVCATPNCHQKNGAWRKFCSKCGLEIYKIHEIVSNYETDEISKRIDHHSREIENVSNRLKHAQRRENMFKILILGFGVALGLAGLVSVGIFGLIFPIAIFGFWWLTYESDEVKNLENSRALHNSDLKRERKKLTD